MEFIGFVGKLKTHERERKLREEKAPQKKKTLAFKPTSLISDEDDQEDDEDSSIFVKNVRRITTRLCSTTEEDSKERRKERSFSTIIESPNTSLPITRRQRANLLPPRSPTKRP